MRESVTGSGICQNASHATSSVKTKDKTATSTYCISIAKHEETVKVIHIFIVN